MARGLDEIVQPKVLARLVRMSYRTEQPEEAAPQDEEEASRVTKMAETVSYDQYRPVHWKAGRDHPDPAVENATLASIDPPKIPRSFRLKIQANKHLSNLQLEAVCYATLAHEGKKLGDGSRAGFLLGDGAGMGKGRVLAGLVAENWLRGRKRHLWVSVSNDLAVDARRDLTDIGYEHIPVFELKARR